MIKKGAKLVMILIMLLGISFSILNFLSLELKAINDGHWEDFQNGASVCMPPALDCSIQMRWPGD